MSLIQIKRNQITKRINQIPIINSSELIRTEITLIVRSILYDMINSIETNHNFVIINKDEIPKKKNIFKRIINTTKRIFT
jgi:hypothetical protein